MKILLCALAMFATLAIAVSSATTVTWKLSKRVHTTGTATAYVSSSSISKPKGLAISAKSTPAQKLTIAYSISCAKGTARPKVRTGSFTSQGLGTQIPIKLNATNPDYCNLSATATPLKGGSLYLSLWRR